MTARAELRAQAVEPWLAAGLRLRRVTSVGERDDPLGWLRVAAAELPALPPAGVIADLGALLAGGRPRTAPATAPGPLRAALRAYDDDLLARLAAAPALDDLIAAVARQPPARQAAAVALVAGAVLGRLHGAGVTAVSAAALRRALARPDDTRAAAGAAGLADAAVVARLADGYTALARAARQVRELLGDRERFALDHLDALDQLGQRVAFAQIADAALALGRGLPRRARRTERGRGDRATRLEDDATYPAGGFTSIAPGGAADGLEGLVTSELLYLEDEPAHGEREVDLFDLRWVEGELLRYTRDDSQLRRRRHTIGVILAPDLAAARVKDAGVPWQRVVVVVGLVVAAVRWLTTQLTDEALAVRIVAPAGALLEERALLALSLGDELERGVVTVGDRDVAAALAELAAERAPLVDAVTIACGAAPATPRGLRHAHLTVGALPVLSTTTRAPDGPGGGTDDDDDGDTAPWDAWCATAADLVRWLV